MLDINCEAEKTLSKLKCAVVYLHPGEFTKLPAVSYFNIAEHGAFYSDNSETVQSGYVQIDVWAKKAKECGTIALKANDVMTADGWMREMSADVPDRDGKIYHKTMRFHKYFSL